MQKKLIALAVAGLASGAAFAQTNVTMYGVADAGYVYSRGGTTTNVIAGTTNTASRPVFSGIQSGLLAGSRIGFKGEEALGNGLKAVFLLEYGLNIDSNSGIAAARQQYVGLAGNWGQLSLGYQYAPGYDASSRNDAFLGALFSPHSLLTSYVGNTISPTGGARWNNSVAYTSGNYGGFQAKAIYAFGENRGSSTLTNSQDNIWDDGRFGLGLNYANGPVNVDFVYQNRHNRRTGPASANVNIGNTASPTLVSESLNGNDTHEWYLGGSFDFKFAKLLASFQQQNDKNDFNNDNRVWQLGAIIPVSSAGNIHLNYAELKLRHVGQGGFIDADGANGKSKSGGVAYSHALSKRTTLYTGLVHIKNDNDTGSISPAGTGVVDRSNTTFVAGINHKF